ncbi:MAG TPA: hypothetical protein VKT22_02775 [Steroidobacteraceae bacterium]|nr:hypothetical protein [Steroidobacteraceae bacterium]
MNRLKWLTMAALPLLALAYTAFAQGITLRFFNDTSRNLRVTAYDLSLQPPQPIISAQTINGFSSITLPVAVNESGHAHIRWTATTMDQDTPRCSHRENADLSDGDTIHVFANEACGAGGSAGAGP